MEQKQNNIAVEHSQCSNLEYTIFSQSEESAAVLVLTHDNREISHLMNEEDNKEITNTWEILQKEANYKNLAHDIICDFINFTRDIGGNLFTRDIELSLQLKKNCLGNSQLNIMSQTCQVIVQLKTFINSHLPLLLLVKVHYTQNLFSPRKSTAILFTLTFPSVPVLLVSLSQNIHHSNVIVTSS